MREYEEQNIINVLYHNRKNANVKDMRHLRKLKDYTPTKFMAEDSHYGKAAALVLIAAVFGYLVSRF